jgi:hypothetical protein
MILVGSRKKATAWFVATSILIPMDQVLVVGGLHFSMLRILALFGIVRLLREKFSHHRRIFSGGINKIDLAVIGVTVSIALAGILLFKEMAAAVYQFGSVYTVFGMYFLLRFLIRTQEDILDVIRTLAYVAAFIAAVMTWEVVTGHSPYALLAGAKSYFYVNLSARDDRIRAVGCFGHSILAGTFGAIILPLFVILWREGKRKGRREGKKDRALAAAGMIAATVITLTSNSSTPILAYAGGVLALTMWPLRNWMRAVRWGIVLTTVTLHLVMKAPVWHLISRIDISGGSSSWHRFNLIDQCIRHFGDWWLIGVKDTADWGWDMWDTANQYVGICDSSGLLAFLLFLATIVYGFKYLGKARKAIGDKAQKIFLWGLGSALFANVVAFVGISYWDQTQVVWYALLAAICVVPTLQRDAMRARHPEASLAAGWAEGWATPAAVAEPCSTAPRPPEPTPHPNSFAS